ncbi:MAG: hypothetical protein P8M62_02865 [Opitutae bacterium]|jgi:hypothetical protein|nr:hypothetical protein [Opitutae bacterium]MDG2344980.1 hypothetical protein [Opitutae bacterium]
MTEESHNPFMEGDEVPSEEAAQAAKLLAAEAAESRAKLAKERAEAALARSEATRDLEPKADASDPKAPIDSSSDIPAAPSKPVLRTVPPTPAPVAPQAPKPANSQATATATAHPNKVQPAHSLATEDSSMVSMPALVIDAIAAALAIAFTVLIIQDALPFLQ